MTLIYVVLTMEQSKITRIGISIGDINGVGIEIILKTFEDKRILEFCTPVLFASNEIITAHKKLLQLTTPINRIQHIDNLVAGKINLVTTWTESQPIEIGQATENGGKYAFKSLEAAVDALKNILLMFWLPHQSTRKQYSQSTLIS